MRKIVPMVTYHCDRCGDRYRDENGMVGYVDYDIWEDANTDGWIEIEGKHYCPDCVEYNEEADEYVPKPKSQER